MKLFFNKSITTIAIMVLALLITSCDTRMAKFFPNTAGAEFDDILKESSLEFQHGWRDGCETGQSGGSNTFYKMFYRNNVVDGYKIGSSRDYKSAWGNAFWYCYRHDYVKQRSSIWGSAFGGYK